MIEQILGIDQIIIFIEIVLIDLVLAGDNAIIIGMVASQFEQNLRVKIIFWGIALAIVFRILLTFVASYLLQFDGLKAIGGFLLIYIAIKLYKDVLKSDIYKKNIDKVDPSNFLKAIFTILLADLVMSLDNVLGVAAAAKQHYILLIFGLTLSILLMATVANIISKWIKKYKSIGWLGFLAILVVAIELIISDIYLKNLYLKLFL